MARGPLSVLGQVLQALGLLAVLLGLSLSMGLGCAGQGLESMGVEFQGLLIGLALFAAGHLLRCAAGGE